MVLRVRVLTIISSVVRVWRVVSSIRVSGYVTYLGGVGVGFWVADLLFQYGCHQIRHGPHVFADLCLAMQIVG